MHQRSDLAHTQLIIILSTLIISGGITLKYTTRPMVFAFHMICLAICVLSTNSEGRFWE